VADRYPRGDKKAAPSAMPDAEVCGPSQGDKNAKPVSL
jgi:hypothetical protein